MLFHFFLDGFVGINKAKTIYCKQKWFTQTADQSLIRQLGREKGKSLQISSTAYSTGLLFFMLVLIWGAYHRL